MADYLGALQAFSPGAKRAVAIQIHGALGDPEFVEREMLEPELRQLHRTRRSAAAEAPRQPQSGLVEPRAKPDAHSPSGFQVELAGERAAQGFPSGVAQDRGQIHLFQ